MGNKDDKSVIHDWLDRLEKIIEEEARLAGLFQHSTLIGTAREFIIQNILKRCLPPVIHYGSGKIFDSNGNYSKQIDLVIFDSRFPCLEINNGAGLYPIEGVIATVEIKSTITKGAIKDALNNQSSVQDLTPKFINSTSIIKSIRAIIDKGVAKDIAEREVAYSFCPSTYIFSFNSKIRKKALANSIYDWCIDNQIPEVCNGICVKLPRIILAGNTLAMLSDGFQSINPGEDVIEEWKRTEGKDDYKHVVGVWDVVRRFGWFAQHLIFDVCNRIGLGHAGIKIDYEVQQYLIQGNYFKKEMERKTARYCLF